MTTAMAMHGYATRDPIITCSIENVTHFLEAWHISPSYITLSIQAVWPDLLAKLEGNMRWASVRGPLSSAIATLLDWLFQSLSYDHWIDPDGSSWILDPASRMFFQRLNTTFDRFFGKRPRLLGRQLFLLIFGAIVL